MGADVATGWPVTPQSTRDLPSLPGHAADHGRARTAYSGSSGCPVSFCTQLHGSAQTVRSDQLSAAAAAAGLSGPLGVSLDDQPLPPATG